MGALTCVQLRRAFAILPLLRLLLLSFGHGNDVPTLRHCLQHGNHMGVAETIMRSASWQQFSTFTRDYVV